VVEIEKFSLNTWVNDVIRHLCINYVANKIVIKFQRLA
jgi:hypothetical protein